MDYRILRNYVYDESDAKTFFACAACGTLASTNSSKRVKDLHIDLDEHDDVEHGQADEDYSVTMTPACPCGCEVFNPVYLSQHGVDWEEV